MKHLIPILSIIFILTSCNIRQEKSHRFIMDISQEEASDMRNSIKDERDSTAINILWNYYLQSGQWDRLIGEARRLFEESIESGNTETSVFAGCFLAIPYVATGNKDSADYFLNYIRPHLKKGEYLHALVSNSEADYALKFEMNYSKAMRHLHDALEYCRINNDWPSIAVGLSNIVILYARRKDTTGLSYAKEAYEISKRVDNPYPKYMSAHMLSYMELLTGNTEMAFKHANEAMNMISGNSNFEIFYSETYTTLGDIQSSLGNENSASTYYKMALSNLNKTLDMNIHARLYNSYARHLYRAGNLKLAKDFYLKGIKIANQSGSTDYLDDLYKGLSEVYEKTGDKDSTLYYYKLYHSITQQEFNLYKEKDFNKLLSDYEKEKLENEIHKRELENMKSRIFIYVILAAFVLASSALIIVYTTYRKRDRMYTLLVEKNESLIQQKKKNRTQDPEHSNTSKTKEDLYSKLEDLMSKEKLYRDKSISVEKLAEILNTNRNYISSIVNKYTGMTFPNYINAYRIDEAISIISDLTKEPVFKKLYEDLGYNSISSFYRAFQKETGCSPMVYRKKIIKLHESEK